MPDPDLERALEGFDADAFCHRHGGYKESRSERSHEWLLTCTACGSDRLRWRHQPGVKQAWVCWGCRRTGDTLDLIEALEGIDRLAAMSYVIDGYNGGDAPSILTTLAQVARPASTDLSRLPLIPYPKGYEPLTWGLEPHTRAWRYLLEVRGISYEALMAARVGYARGGRLGGYVIFPVFMDGGLVYWQARATWDAPAHLDREQRRAWSKATGYRKTLNPTATQTTVGASEILYGYDAVVGLPHVVITEGPVDALKVGPHAVALLGKVATSTKVERLRRLATQRYTVYLDPGVEERAKAEGLAAQLADFAPTFVAEAPEGADPGMLTPAQNAEVIAKAPRFRRVGLVSNLR